MGYGISKAAGGGKGQAGGVREGESEREALLRSVSAGSQSFEGFFLNEKKEVMRDEAMFEMWSSVSGGQASAAAPDGGGGPQSRKPEGEETVNRISDMEYRKGREVKGGRWKAGSYVNVNVNGWKK